MARFDRIEISDEDIEALHSSVDKVLSIAKDFSGMSTDTLDSFDQLKRLLTADMLRTLQLLGFNYHEAIDDPLTKICQEAILKWGHVQTNNSAKKNRRQ